MTKKFYKIPNKPYLLVLDHVINKHTSLLQWRIEDRKSFIRYLLNLNYKINTLWVTTALAYYDRSDHDKEKPYNVPSKAHLLVFDQTSHKRTSLLQ
jgi:hypothetical protein